MCFQRCSFSFSQDKTARCRYLILPEKLLGKSFVHSDRTSQIATSGITDAQQIKGCLNFSILAVFSMQCQKYHISFLTKLNNIFSKESFSFLNTLFHAFIKASCISCCRIHIIFLRKCLLQICFLISEINIQKNRLMSSASKCLAYLCTRYNGNLPFCTDATC